MSLWKWEKIKICWLGNKLINPQYLRPKRIWWTTTLGLRIVPSARNRRWNVSLPWLPSNNLIPYKRKKVVHPFSYGLCFWHSPSLNVHFLSWVRCLCIVGRNKPNVLLSCTSVVSNKPQAKGHLGSLGSQTTQNTHILYFLKMMVKKRSTKSFKVFFLHLFFF